jgi:signal transduction histidine kinase
VFANLAVAALAGASRNVSVGVLAAWSGLGGDNLWLFRFIGGAFMGVAIFVLWAFATGSRHEYQVSLERLNRLQSELSTKRTQMPEQLVEINAGLQERTRNALFPQIEAIRNLLGDDTRIGEALEKLRFTIRVQIRPMMEEISDSQPKPFELKNIKRLKSIRASLPDRFTLRDKISLGWSSFLETLGVSIWLWVYSSPNGFLDNLALFLIYGTVLSLFKYLVPRERQFARFNAVAYVLLATFLASASNIVYIYSVLGFDQGKSLMFAGFALLSGILGPIILMQLAVTTARRAEIESEITSELLEIAKENSLFAQRLWVFRKRWLLVLHGSVQSSLTAALTRLQKADVGDPVVLELVKQDLRRAEKAVETNLNDEVDLEAGLLELQAVWAGICDIQVQVSGRAKRALSRSHDSSFCVNEIVKEAVSNAVRHGEASEAHVVIDRVADDLLQIEVSNNGTAPGRNKQQGIGSEMLDEICLSWDLISDKKMVRLVAELPVKL